MAELVAGGVTLRDQINNRWVKRDKASDGWLGDAAHAARTSDHNPDKYGNVHAIDVDEDLRGSKNDNIWLADQIIANARMKRVGSERLKYAVYEEEIASGTYPATFWVWRGDNFGHTAHMHVSFTKAAEKDGSQFSIPILLDGKAGVWDGVTPYYDLLLNASKSGLPTKATWRLACRLKELGFYDGTVLPEGRQAFPKNAVRKMQDYMGWERRDYDVKVHKGIWRELRITDTDKP